MLKPINVFLSPGLAYAAMPLFGPGPHCPPGSWNCSSGWQLAATWKHPRVATQFTWHKRLKVVTPATAAGLEVFFFFFFFFRRLRSSEVTIGFRSIWLWQVVLCGTCFFNCHAFLCCSDEVYASRRVAREPCNSDSDCHIWRLCWTRLKTNQKSSRLRYQSVRMSVLLFINLFLSKIAALRWRAS